MLELNSLSQLLARVIANPFDVVLIALLVAAAVIDWRTYRIPNWLTYGGMTFGLLYNAAAHGFMAGMLPAMSGLGLGLVLLLPLYALRVMGAGDVKLMAMVGAFLGSPEILYAVLFTFVAAGIAALAFALWLRSFTRVVRNVGGLMQSVAFAAMAGHRPERGMASIGKMPYGISICVGTVAWLAVTRLG